MIKVHFGKCEDCTDGKVKPLAKRKPPLCSYHNKKRKGKPKKIQRTSKSLQTKLATYREIKKEWMNKPENLFCKIRSPVCTHYTDAPHHMKGRIGKDLTDTDYWLPSCNPCNGYIESRSAWARENGFTLSRLANT